MDNILGYSGKTCVVTGASSGIGKALCAKLTEQGANVYALDIQKASLAGLTAFYEVDLSSKEDIDKVFAELPKSIDKFFGVAGLSGSKTGYWTTFTVNFIANRYITETYLKERMPEGSAISYVTSTGGLMWEKWAFEYKKMFKTHTWDEMTDYMKKHFAPSDGPGAMAYTLSKRMMNYYTALASIELGKQGIRVNALLPGATISGMSDEFEKMAGGHDKLVAENGSAGRLATPEEQADPLLYLNSDLATFVSGLHLIADSGHNSETVLGYTKNQLNIPAALKFYSSDAFGKAMSKRA